jgi:hypothetical protein
MLCEAAIMETFEDSDEVSIRSCGEPAVTILKALIGPQAGQEHSSCRFHSDCFLRDYPEGFELVKDLEQAN